MKIVYMGTPDFAVAPLAALTEAGYEVEAVVTQPDKPKGRGKTLLPTPVKEEALKHGIPVLQPVKVRDPEFVKELEALAPDIIIVAAFGQIIPKSVLDMPKFGCINIHASLLPKYRGAAPIQQAVIDGEKESGVTIMQMGTGLDTGDMISKIVVPLAEDETGGSHKISRNTGKTGQRNESVAKCLYLHKRKDIKSVEKLCGREEGYRSHTGNRTFY